MLIPDLKCSNLTLSPGDDCKELIFININGTRTPLLVKEGERWVVNAVFTR